MQLENEYHYRAIRRAIEIIDAADHILGLEELLCLMDLRPADFQQVFATWAEISLHKYQQYLTQGYTKNLLRDKCAALVSASSLSPLENGYLHDLSIHWEVMSPGDHAARASGLTIYEGWFSSPFGEVIAMGTGHGLCALGFVGEMGHDQARSDLAKRWPLAIFEEKPNQLAPWVAAIFASKGNIDLHVMGTPLQIKVWEALIRIPSGFVTTYSSIAKYIHNPKAVRAVGTAVGRNPLSFIIPCHRVLLKSGELGGYHWGTPVKRMILAFEGVRGEATQ